ncbi:uncharacterized protein LOC131878122 [Tigriopus californicus]|uniref:uncharacterized protein LOC131878122 n=1 Tax=Tigriopus californicus TaxID=6832 RepID=UPI0027DA71B9|nr:uncharacterized protein LOC131878122 [Tigriopus californicus]
MNEGQTTCEAQDDVVDAGGKSREKMLEHFKANATKLSRSSSWKSPPLNLKEAKRASSKVKDCKLPASLQHLQLEASNCPSSMKISIKPFERACPAHTDTVATSSSREDTLSPAVSGKSFGESTETLINIDETVAFGPKNGSNLARNVNALIPAQKNKEFNNAVAGRIERVNENMNKDGIKAFTDLVDRRVERHQKESNEQQRADSAREVQEEGGNKLYGLDNGSPNVCGLRPKARGVDHLLDGEKDSSG